MKSKITAVLALLALSISTLVAGPAQAGTAPIRVMNPAGQMVEVGAPLAARGPIEARPRPVPGKRSAAKLAGHYEYASKYQYVTGGSDGATVKLQVSNPFVATGVDSSAHSVAELACQSEDGSNTVEIGWRKGLGDSTPWLFTYSWIGGVPQGYGVGFTPVSGVSHHVGDYLSATTSTNRVLWKIGCQYFGGVWWLGWDSTPGTFEWIGYYSGTLWSGASPAQTFVKSELLQVYGEVYADTGTNTDMGNGQFGCTTASCIANPGATQYTTYSLINPPSGVVAQLTKYDSDPTLYRSSAGTTSAYFGGTGTGGNVGS